MFSEKPKLHEREKKYKRGKLKTINLDITGKCNMNCKHCYSVAFRDSNPVELAVLKRVFDEAYELGVTHFILGGGEPITVPERLESIVDLMHPDESYLTLVSNGWEMSIEKIRWLKKLKVDKICLSLDAGTPEEHDKNRAPGSYDRVIEAIDNVMKEGLFVAISGLVTHHDLHNGNFLKLYEIAESKKIRLDIAAAVPAGKWAGRNDILLTLEDQIYLRNLYDTCPTISNGRKMIHRSVYLGGENRCPAGSDGFNISVDGNVFACCFIQHSFGNIRDKSLKEMYEAMIKVKYFNGYSVCPCVEDREFIDKYITPYAHNTTPSDAYEVFGLCEKGKNNQ